MSTTGAILVQKFGGSSLKDAERIGMVADRVASTATHHALVVVVSAMGDTTDHLIGLAREVAPAPEKREIDMLLATGEQVSASLLAMALHARGRTAISLTGWQAGIRTDRIFGSARIREIAAERLRHELDAGRVPIVTGFQGIAGETGWEEVTTLGRGGSDATAVALAAGLGAACHIYTDVAGIYTADPRVEPRARKLPTISYEEMLELSQYGAQVMMPRSVELAQIWNVPLEVRSSYTDESGTRIEGRMEYAQRVAGVAHQQNVAKVTLVHLADRPGVAHAVFAALAERHVNADLIVQNMGFEGYTDLSYCVPVADLEPALDATRLVRDRVGAHEIRVKENLAKVSVVGAGLSSGAGYAATMFGALADLDINIDMISTSGVRITCVIDGSDVERAVRGLHEAFHLGSETWEASA